MLLISSQIFYFFIYFLSAMQIFGIKAETSEYININ